MRAKRTDREPRKIPGVPPRPPTNWRKKDQVYDPQEAKKNRINFESDIKAIEKELLMQKDQLLERQMAEIRKKGAFKKRTWKDNMASKADVNDPKRTDFANAKIL